MKTKLLTLLFIFSAISAGSFLVSAPVSAKADSYSFSGNTNDQGTQGDKIIATQSSVYATQTTFTKVSATTVKNYGSTTQGYQVYYLAPKFNLTDEISKFAPACKDAPVFIALTSADATTGTLFVANLQSENGTISSCSTTVGRNLANISPDINGNVSISPDHVKIDLLNGYYQALKTPLSPLMYAYYKTLPNPPCSSQGCSDDMWKIMVGLCWASARTDAAATSRLAGQAAGLAWTADQVNAETIKDFAQCLAPKINGAAGSQDIVKLLANLDVGSVNKKGGDASQTAQNALSDTLKANGPPPTSCAIENIGWLICPVMNFLGSVADGMYGIIEGFLVTNVKVVDTESGTYTAWQAMRSFANVGFVIVFLVIIFSQLSSVGISNYGVKKLLPRLIVVAILVNISFLISQLAVDLSNILGGSLKTLLDGIPIYKGALEGNVLAQGNWITGIVSSWLSGTVIGIVVIGAGTAAYYGGIGLLIPVILVAVVAILMTLFILIARQALIILLVVVSPLAFLAMLLPNTETFFKKWRKAFVALLLVYPAIALLFGGARLASGILAQTLTGPMGPIVSLAVMVLPLFFVPALLKGSLNAIPAIGGLAQKLSSGASRGTRSLSKKGTDYLGQRAASGDSKFAQRVSKSLQGNGMYGKRRQAAARRNYREPRMKDLMDGWSNDGTADNYGELEKIAGQNPSSFQGQAALQILASKSETETLQRIRQKMTDPEQIKAYNKAIQPNYGALKARDPRAVKSGDDLVAHYNKITQEQLHAMSQETREAGIALSGGGGSAYSATLGAAMSDPLQSRFFTPKELGRAGDYASIPGGQNFNQSGTEPSTQTVPSVPQKTEAPIDPAWAAWHTEGQTNQTVININHNGEATVGVAPQPQDARASQAEAKSAAIAEAKRLQSSAGNQDIHTDGGG